MVFSKFRVVIITTINFTIFSSPQKETQYPSTVSQFPIPLNQEPLYFLSLYMCPFWILYINGII